MESSGIPALTGSSYQDLLIPSALARLAAESISPSNSINLNCVKFYNCTKKTKAMLEMVTFLWSD